MKRTLLFSTLFLFPLLLCFTSCTSRPSDKDNTEVSKDTDEEDNTSNLTDNESGPESVEDAMKELTNALQQLNDGEKVEAVNFRELKKLLPEKMMGMDRTKWEGESTGVVGIKYSHALAEYKDGNASIEINIVDGAGFAGIVSSMAAWSVMEVDRETESGYERTTTIDGNKAFEKYDNDSKDGQVSVMMEDRFIVNVQGENVSMKDLRQALDNVKITKLKKTL